MSGRRLEPKSWRRSIAVLVCVIAGRLLAAPLVGPEVQLDTSPLIPAAPYTSAASGQGLAMVAWNVSPTTAFSVRWALVAPGGVVVKPGTGADATGEFSRFGFAAAGAPHGFLVAAADCSTAQWVGVIRVGPDGGTSDGPRTRAGIPNTSEVSATWTGTEWWLLERASPVHLVRVPRAGPFAPNSLPLSEIDARSGRLSLASDESSQWAVWSDSDGGISFAAFGTDAGLRVGPRAVSPGPSQTEPAIAFGGGWFAVVWTSMRDGGADVLGQFFRPDGTPRTADPIEFGGGPGTQQWPSVVWDGESFTIVWEHATSTAFDVWATRVSSAGVVLEVPFPVTMSPSSERRPSVASFARGELLVSYTAADETPRARSLSFQSPDAGASDAGPRGDAGAIVDAGAIDAGSIADAGSIDAGSNDAGAMDVDAGSIDSGASSDAGTRPTLQVGAPPNARCGEQWRLALENPTGAIVLREAPEGVVVDGSGLTWTPGREQQGTQRFTIASGSSTTSFWVEVECTARSLGVGCDASGGVVSVLWVLVLSRRRRGRATRPGLSRCDAAPRSR